MKSTLLFLFVVLISLACFTHFASAADPMDAAKTAWANTPHGQVWLNPGDAYEHNTGLVRDAAGFHRHPNSSVQRSFPMYNHSPQPRYHVPSYVARLSTRRTRRLTRLILDLTSHRHTTHPVRVRIADRPIADHPRTDGELDRLTLWTK